MASIAKTVGSFDKVLASCKSIGARYQPQTPELTNIALSQLYERAQQSLRAVTATRIAYRMAVNDRKDSFAGISKLAARIVRMMSASRGNPSHIADAVLIKNKFYQPKKSQKFEELTQSVAGHAPARRSSGRLSFDQQTETFRDLVRIAHDIGTYNPVEAELTLDALDEKLADLQSRSLQVNRAQVAFNNARIDRDQVIFGPDGMQNITKAVKDYILGAFGKISIESDMIIS
jgi:hypothetical protein